MGNEVEAVTSATIDWESVNVVIVQPAATACTSPPRFEISVATHRDRNTGFLKGANDGEGCEVPLGLMGFVFSGSDTLTFHYLTAKLPGSVI
jgi:hypothetical protein